MKTIHEIIEKSALGSIHLFLRYLVVTLFMAVVGTVMTLFIKVLGNADYVTACFNF